MDTLTSLRVFRTVAELRSFSAAADRLDLSPAMASKHVMHLEKRLTSRLLNRTSRHVSLTETGALYLEQARLLLDGLDEVEAAVSEGSTVPRGALRMSAPAWFANPAFARMIAEFSALHPQVRFEIDLSGRVVNLVDEGFDLAIKATPPDALDPGLVARRLAEIEFHLVASPAHLDRTGRPATLADLGGRPFLLFSGTRSDGAFPLEGPHGTETVKFDVVFESGNETMLRQLAIEGMGLTFAPKWTIGGDLKAGRLELVLPDTLHAAGLLYAVYPSRHYLSAKVRAFIDFLVKDASRKFGNGSEEHFPSGNIASTTPQLMMLT
jgi:DNA-binding transcriptional LysR family regulator